MGAADEAPKNFSMNIGALDREEGRVIVNVMNPN